MQIPYDTAVQFGWSAFETMAVVNNYLFRLPSHLARLERACAFLDLPFSTELAEERILSYLGKQNLPYSALKLQVTPSDMVLTHRDNPYDNTARQRGFHLTLSSVLRNETSPFTYHKTGNYGDNILAKRQAHAQGMDEPLFLNSRGELTEGATTNVFLYLDGEWVTPPISCGLLPGTMRDYVIKKMPVREQILTISDLSRATHVFVTNALLGIMPVTACDSISYNANLPKECQLIMGNVFNPLAQ